MESHTVSGEYSRAAFLREWRGDDAARLLDLVRVSDDLANQFSAHQLRTVGECERFIRSTYAPRRDCSDWSWGTE